MRRNLRLPKDDFGTGIGKGQDCLLRRTELKNEMVKDSQCGHLKRRPSLDFVRSDKRGDAITSRNECALEFSICHVERAQSKRYGNGASSQETQIKAQAFGFADRRQPDGGAGFTIDLPSLNNDLEILSIEESACD